MRGQSSNMITVAQRAVGTFYVSGVPFGQYIRALCSSSVVGFSAVSPLSMRGQSADFTYVAQWTVGTFCVSGVPFGL
jgi:hypothetical protein